MQTHFEKIFGVALKGCQILTRPKVAHQPEIGNMHFWYSPVDCQDRSRNAKWQVKDKAKKELLDIRQITHVPRPPT